MLCFPMLISSLPDANSLPPEHKIEVFVRFWPSGPPFLALSSTKWFFVKFRAVKLSKFGRF